MAGCQYLTQEEEVSSDPTLWSETFEEKVNQELQDCDDKWTFQTNYSLTETLPEEEEKRGWKIFRHFSHGQFKCGSCFRTWPPTRRVMVLFWYRLYYSSRRGTVLMRPLSQACRRCQEDKFERPEFSQSEVEKTLLRLLLTVRRNCYGEESLGKRRDVSGKPHLSYYYNNDPTLWSETFEEKVNEELQDCDDKWTFQTNYSLTETLPEEEEERGWKIFNHFAHGQFKCGSCFNTWPSTRVMVVFWYRLLNSSGRGTVLMRPLGQACRHCQDKFERPEFSQSEVEKTLLRLLQKVRRNCYGEEEEEKDDDEKHSRKHSTT